MRLMKSALLSWNLNNKRFKLPKLRLIYQKMFVLPKFQYPK